MKSTKSQNEREASTYRMNKEARQAEKQWLRGRQQKEEKRQAIESEWELQNINLLPGYGCLIYRSKHAKAANLEGCDDVPF